LEANVLPAKKEAKSPPFLGTLTLEVKTAGGPLRNNKMQGTLHAPQAGDDIPWGTLPTDDGTTANNARGSSGGAAADTTITLAGCFIGTLGTLVSIIGALSMPLNYYQRLVGSSGAAAAIFGVGALLGAIAIPALLVAQQKKALDAVQRRLLHPALLCRRAAGELCG
jgi:hypothetical protein